MKMLSFFVKVVALVGICVISFNYVKNHDSTRQEQTIKEQFQEMDKLSTEIITLRQDNANVTGRLRQACSLLELADINNNVCQDLGVEEVLLEPEAVEPEAVEPEAVEPEAVDEENSNG